MKHNYMSDKLTNHISMSSARDDKLFKIKLWLWNNIIDNKHGWFWFVEDHLDGIDFTSKTTAVKQMACDIMKKDDKINWSNAINISARYYHMEEQEYERT